MKRVSVMDCLGPALKFVGALNKLERFKSGGIIAWLDYTKFGKLSNTDINETLDLVATTLSKHPERSCAFKVCPHLISEKVQNGIRGEIRV